MYRFDCSWPEVSGVSLHPKVTFYRNICIRTKLLGNHWRIVFQFPPSTENSKNGAREGVPAWPALKNP